MTICGSAEDVARSVEAWRRQKTIRAKFTQNGRTIKVRMFRYFSEAERELRRMKGVHGEGVEMDFETLLMDNP